VRACCGFSLEAFNRWCTTSTQEQHVVDLMCDVVELIQPALLTSHN
jgi:hypothetical protein